MQVVPAIDVKDGKVVRAVAGERMAYMPIQSKLSDQSDPEAISQALRDQLGLEQVYLADLDAIEGAEPAWELYVQLIDCGLDLWIDAGIATESHCEQMVEFAHHHAQVNGIIGGLETIPDCATFEKCLELVGPTQFIFSLDLKDGRPLTNDSQWQRSIAADIATQILTAGVTRMILIDLARVGMHGGCGTRKLCRHLHKRFPDVALYGGGGIRNVEDLNDLKTWGYEAALVSSALHDEWITREALDSLTVLNKTD